MVISKQFKEKEGKINKNKTITVKIEVSKTNWEYFSITFEIAWRNRVECCGAGEEYIRKHFGNQFDDILALHLSDTNGIPLHALENGFYYLQNPNEYPIYPIEVTAKHFRISNEEAEELRPLSKEQLSQWIEHRKPIWKQEADEVRKKYNI
jgi:hypothetical protein